MSWEDDLLKETPRGLTGGEDTVPGARWADPDALDERWTYDRSSFFLGYRQGRNIGCRDDRHVLLVAGSRAGKGVSLVIPNLLLYEGSVLAIDPKGELARATSKQRRKLGEVVILDPFNTTQAPDRAKFNPLAEIDPDSETAVDDAARLAEALIIEEGGGDKHWINGARELVKGFILFALRQKDPALRTLVTVRNFFHVASAPDDAQPDLIDGDGEGKGKRSKTIPGYRRVLRAMAKQGDAFGGLVAAIGSSYDTKDERELAGLVSTADVQLAFLDSPPLRKCLSQSTFRLADLKTKTTTVFMCLPAGRMATHAKWLRAIIDLALVMCENVPHRRGRPPLLFVLDEFPVLGHMRSIESAAGQIAGFGVKLFTIVQDLTQLQRFYDRSWETFVGNAGASLFFGVSDVTSLSYVSDKIGTIGFDLRRRTGASLDARMAGARAFDEQFQLTKLLEPHEVELMFAREKERLLVLYPGVSPLILRRAVYHRDPAFQGLS